MSGIQRFQFTTTDFGSYGNFLDAIQVTLKPFVEFGNSATASVEGASSPNLPVIRISGNLPAALAVQVQVTGGTATLGSDYTTPTGTNSFVVTIPAGNYTGATFPVGIAIVSSPESEAPETIDLAISADPTNYILSSTVNCGQSAIGSAVHTITDPVPVLSADPDSATNINGVTGVADVLDVLDGDTLNGQPVSSATVNLRTVTPAASVGGAPVPTLGADGKVSVPAGTPSGTYSIVYEICDRIFPTACATATATLTVNPAADVAITKTNTPGQNGNIDLPDDRLTLGLVTTYVLTVLNNGPDQVTGVIVTDTPVSGLNCPATNPVTITGSGVPAGSYTIANLVNTGAGIALGTLLVGQSTTLTFDCVVGAP